MPVSRCLQEYEACEHCGESNRIAAIAHAVFIAQASYDACGLSVVCAALDLAKNGALNRRTAEFCRTLLGKTQS